MQFTVEFQADHLKAVLEAARQAVAMPQQMIFEDGRPAGEIGIYSDSAG